MSERTCKLTGVSFKIHPEERVFLEKLTFTFGSTKITLPEPVYCPNIRSQIRTSHRNEKNLYRVKSAMSGKEIVSIYHAEPIWGDSYRIFSQEEWRGENWDPMYFGKDIDFSKPFFEQFFALHKQVPRMALTSLGNQNSGFTTGTGYCKNCYLINSSEYCEDCYYSKLLQNCSSCIDCSYAYNCELCYECFSVSKCYNCQHLSFSQNSTDCYFSSNLRSCKHCCLCTNLDHKEYCFLNEQLTKEEYEKRLQEFRGSHERTERMKTLYKDLLTKMNYKYSNISNSVDCTGDYIEDSKNCKDCYDVTQSEDCMYVCVGVNVKDNVDCSNMYIKSELCYDTLGTIEAHSCAYCLYVFHSQRMLYSEYCFHSSDCFGCSGLTRKQYCIFNKQYTKEEYEALVPKLIEHMQTTGEWGLFFPAKFSSYGYNESVAQEYFPLEKQEAVKLGFHWREEDKKDFRSQTTELPDQIQDATDSLTQEIYSCAKTGKNYRIIPQELDFYRRQKLPLPRLCPDSRYANRLELRNKRELHPRKCNECGKDVLSTFNANRPETILCEECFLKSSFQ